MENSHTVLLYYKYVTIKNPKHVMFEQKQLCQNLNLTGRIIIANEGINGTIEGTKDSTEKYIKTMQKNKYFSNITFKKSIGKGDSFPKLKVKVRPEIVTAGIKNLNPLEVSGKYVTAEQLQDWYAAKKEFYIVDMRNDYEYQSGHFENSIASGLQNFFDLPKIVPKLKHLRNKIIVTVCTGGIRCEKASGFLIQNGFTDVYQLKEGIHNYLEKYSNAHYKGKLYVFDNRLTLGFNTSSSKVEIVGKCLHCSKPCDNYVNCEYNKCHYHYIACSNCKDKDLDVFFCTANCKKIFLLTQALKNSAN